MQATQSKSRVVEKKTGTNPKHDMLVRAMNQIRMLTAMFVLGMAVNLVGLPQETTGFAKTATLIFLGLHVLIAVGLVIGSVITLRLTLRAAPQLGRLAWIGLALIAVTFGAGVLTVWLKSDWWSYVMALGFIGSFLIYGSLCMKGNSPVSDDR
ncbi:MAG TPA: hypothetical protein VK249_20120 [Anaerolineales bacterium]|nr:hypothetical protein [Anaerolineales bacterium]